MRRRTFTVPSTSGLRLGPWLAQALGCPVEDAESLIQAGAVYVQGRRVTEAARALTPGAKVSVVLEERGHAPGESGPEAVPLEVLFQDADVVAVNKPAGIPAQATASRAHGHLQERVSALIGGEAGLVHRLDRETSGVTIFGKTAAATATLAEQFRQGVPKKRYLAITGPGLPEAGHLDAPLSPDPAHKGRFRASRTANGKAAVTDFQRLYGDQVFSIVSARPQTGRTHQIRAHLAGIGFPLAGDGLYRGPMQLGGAAIPRCLLHAQRLELVHPRTGAPLVITADVPEDLSLWLTRAGQSFSADES